MDDLISRKDAINALSMMQGIVAENGVRKGISMAWQQIADLPSAQQKGDIEEAVEYIKNAQEYLRDIGETWCANYLSDAIELLVGERRGEEDG